MTSYKKLRLAWMASAFAIGACMTFTACSDETTGGGRDDSSVIEGKEEPTTDLLGNVYKGKTFVFGNDRTGFDAAVTARIANPATEFSKELDAVVVTKGAQIALSPDTLQTLMKLYANNANIVLVGTTRDNNEQFAARISNVASQLEKQGVNSEMAYALAKRINSLQEQAGMSADSADAVAFRANSVYTAKSLRAASERTAQEAVGDAAPNAYQYGLSADGLVQWMTDGDNLDGGNDEALYGMQTFTMAGAIGKTRARKRTMNYNVKYEIISLYNPSKDEDYYLVHAVPTFLNSQFDYEWGSKWYTAVVLYYFDENGNKVSVDAKEPTNSMWAGPYLRSVSIKANVKAVGGAQGEIAISDPKPVDNDNATKTSDVGFNFTSDKVYPFTQQIDAKSEAGSFDYVTETTLPDGAASITQRLSNAGDSAAVEWNFEGNKMSLTETKTPSEIKEFQYNDWTTHLVWTVVVKHPKQGERYQLETTVVPVVDEFNKNQIMVTASHVNKATITLPEPIRSKRAYRLEYQASGDQESWLLDNDDKLSGDTHITVKHTFYANACTDQDGRALVVRAFNKYVAALKEQAKLSGAAHAFSLKLVDVQTLETVASSRLNFQPVDNAEGEEQMSHRHQFDDSWGQLSKGGYIN